MYILSFQETVLKKPVNPEEELRWISQEVRGYVEAVLSSLAANVPKLRPQSFWGFPNFFFHAMQCLTILVEQAVVLCQVEKAKEDMLNQLYTSIRLVLSNYFQVLGISLSICYFQGKNLLLFFPCVIYLCDLITTLLISSFLRFKVDLVVHTAMFFMKNENFYLLRSWFRFCCFSLLGASCWGSIHCISTLFELLWFCSAYMYISYVIPASTSQFIRAT